MTTLETIEKFIDSPKWTDGEKWVIKWQFGLLGDFNTALANCIKQADEGNLLKLSRGFPMEVHAFQQWSRGDLGTRLRKSGLDI